MYPIGVVLSWSLGPFDKSGNFGHFLSFRHSVWESSSMFLGSSRDEPFLLTVLQLLSLEKWYLVPKAVFCGTHDYWVYLVAKLQPSHWAEGRNTYI